MEKIDKEQTLSKIHNNVLKVLKSVRNFFTSQPLNPEQMEVAMNYVETVLDSGDQEKIDALRRRMTPGYDNTEPSVYDILVSPIMEKTHIREWLESHHAEAQAVFYDAKHIKNSQNNKIKP